MIWTVAFWKGAGERALKTFLQTSIPTLLLALGASSSGTLNVWTAPWVASLQIAVGLGLGAAFLSLCTSLGNADFTAGTVTATGAGTVSDPAVITTAPVVPASLLQSTLESAQPAADPAQPENPAQP